MDKVCGDCNETKYTVQYFPQEFVERLLQSVADTSRRNYEIELFSDHTANPWNRAALILKKHEKEAVDTFRKRVESVFEEYSRFQVFDDNEHKAIMAEMLEKVKEL